MHDFVRESSLFVPGTENLTSTGKLYAQDWDIIAKHAGLIPANVSHNLSEKATAACEPWCAGHTQGGGATNAVGKVSAQGANRACEASRETSQE